jgi:hypothetical protein
MDQRTRNESGSGCGVLSQRMMAPRIASCAARSAGLGALLLLTTVIAGAGCAGDSNSTGTVTGTGASGTGGSNGAGGSGSGGSGGGGNLDASTDCAIRTDVDQYSANMTKKGLNGLMSFLLIQSDPGPPVFGSNVWKLKVTGSDGMPVSSGLTVSVFMPEHGHFSPMAPVITYDASTGVYGLDPIYLSMGGKWRITFSITDPNDSALVIDKVEFFFCVA